ncbi:hypothetical protein SALBM217S_00032 [Streptomyces griseoloalbus]
MPELRVVAVSNDGTRLVLKAADSTEYTLPIDERLRAAVRGDRPRLGQIEIEVESHLRPRDIQARIRAGATAEEVAQMAGIPVDRVRRFEGPVLAERAFMAERARKTPVRRPGENSGPPLGETVQERLLLRGAEKDTVQWDSWRRDDGTWEVLLVYRVAGEPHSASWTYDPPRRLVQAVDDEARSLIGESDDLAAPEPSFPFVPRIARLPARPPAGPPRRPRAAQPARPGVRAARGVHGGHRLRRTGLADQPAGGRTELPGRGGADAADARYGSARTARQVRAPAVRPDRRGHGTGPSAYRSAEPESVDDDVQHAAQLGALLGCAGRRAARMPPTATGSMSLRSSPAVAPASSTIARIC